MTGSLNVFGLKRCSKFQEFTPLVHRYDIFLVSETRLDKNDIIFIDGYEFINIPRKQKSFRKSGGL